MLGGTRVPGSDVGRMDIRDLGGSTVMDAPASPPRWVEASGSGGVCGRLSEQTATFCDIAGARLLDTPAVQEWLHIRIVCGLS